ncbi:MAG: bifunctional phosphoribosylaminoimidazolecarboxamide formyltransferase/IMP cyclohydrolase [Candidatus Levybacteria bacterium]|nr:bifunctional phosphoribosylaminoimidazolecarboxamide formyltransferase/IMP cyclohydrolase [Candidatus Levybacteria bacterium]
MTQKTDKYALISVFDKTGIVEFAKDLSSLGHKIISTGGTAKKLTENGVSIVPIQEITGNPESFDGRMKTISFQIESGILFNRSKPSHVKEAIELGIKAIDIVVCNLYPFEKTINSPKVSLEDAIENIDIGGPTMIRAAAKNFENVLIIIDPSDYQKVTESLKTSKDSFEFRKELAAKAFSHISFYDSQIAKFLNTDLFPKEITIPGRLTTNLRYGENTHQKAAFYTYPNNNEPLKNLIKLFGRDLSLVNITDINAGIESVRMFNQPAGVIIKHNSPCGIALGNTAEEALKRAIEADPESAFGGAVILNTLFDINAAKVIGAFKDERRANIDIVAAPEIEKEAVEYLSQVRRTMGLYTFGGIPPINKNALNTKWIEGGFILQTNDNWDIERSFENWTIVTDKKPTNEQLEQMKIAWKFITRIKSNAVIVIDKKEPMTRGIGCGQTSRVRSTKIALKQAGLNAKGAILAGDSFFPFDDSVKLAAKYGIAAIIQQGGSINDKASIEAANKAGIPMVLTHRRAFWH